MTKVRNFRKNINRFFSDMALAESSMKAIAIEFKSPVVYLYRQKYGPNLSLSEYSVRLHNEVIDPHHDNIVKTLRYERKEQN